HVVGEQLGHRREVATGDGAVSVLHAADVLRLGGLLRDLGVAVEEGVVDLIDERHRKGGLTHGWALLTPSARRWGVRAAAPPAPTRGGGRGRVRRRSR